MANLNSYNTNHLKFISYIDMFREDYQLKILKLNSNQFGVYSKISMNGNISGHLVALLDVDAFQIVVRNPTDNRELLVADKKVRSVAVIERVIILNFIELHLDLLVEGKTDQCIFYNIPSLYEDIKKLLKLKGNSAVHLGSHKETTIDASSFSNSGNTILCKDVLIRSVTRANTTTSICLFDSITIRKEEVVVDNSVEHVVHISKNAPNNPTVVIYDTNYDKLLKLFALSLN